MVVHRAMLRRIYDWCIDAADKPYALWILGAVSFAESSFFPVPPDVMLLPMSLARPRHAWLFATWCTIASVAGGVLGYAIGALLYDSLGQWLINLYGLGGTNSSGAPQTFVRLRIHTGGNNSSPGINNGGGEQTTFIPGPVAGNVHVVVINNPAAGYLQWYLNGHIANSNAVTALLTGIRGTNNSSNLIGQHVDGTGGMIGSIDEFRIYNGALSDDAAYVTGQMFEVDGGLLVQGRAPTAEMEPVASPDTLDAASIAAPPRRPATR